MHSADSVYAGVVRGYNDITHITRRYVRWSERAEWAKGEKRRVGESRLMGEKRRVGEIRRVGEKRRVVRRLSACSCCAVL